MKTLTALISLLLLGLSSPGVLAQEGETYIYFNDIHNPSSLEVIKAHLWVEDVVDGDLSDEIYVVEMTIQKTCQHLGTFQLFSG